VQLPFILEEGDEPLLDKALDVARRHAAPGVGRLRSSTLDERVGDVITLWVMPSLDSPDHHAQLPYEIAGIGRAQTAFLFDSIPKIFP
jgi:hypothetical protein